MCVISLKKAGVDFPPIEDMKACFERNKDGAGFMFAKGGKVHYAKGIMTWEAFEKVYPTLVAMVGKDGVCVIHFRIGTHGAKDATMTHPFPLTDNPEELKQQLGVTNYALMHNGVMGQLPSDKDLSDTAVLVKDFLYPMMKANLDAEAKIRILEILRSQSRLIMLDGNGTIEMLGSWETEPNGVLYSNTHWKPVAPRPVSTGGTNHRYGAYDYDDERWPGFAGASQYYANHEWDPIKREYVPKKATPTGQASSRKESTKAQTGGSTKARKSSPNGEFEWYDLSQLEMDRLVEVIHPIRVGGMVLDPNEKGLEDLYVLDGHEVFQLWNESPPDFIKVGNLDSFGSNFASPEEFLSYMEEFHLLGMA